MTSKFKQLFAAAALTLIIGGSIGANALTNMNDDPKNGWYGQTASGETFLPGGEPNQLADCDGDTPLCAIEYANDVAIDDVEGGPYNGQ